MNVIAVGIEPALLTGHESAPLTLPIDAPKDALNDLRDDLREHAIAILPAGRLEPALRRLHVLQSALDGRCRIACVQTDLSPLAASALVRLAASVAPAAPSAALLADAVPALEHELLVAAVLPSVLRLRRPRPPFGARLRSLLPGARFLVSPEPEPVVASLRRAGAVPWQSVGGTGDPRDASPEEQWMRAYMLYQRRGWQPWECATEKLGYA